MKYPVKWGYESWIVYKVRQLGYDVKRYDDVLSQTRKIRMYPDKAFKWGKCSYALGGSLPFALGKAVTFGLNGFHYMRGYFARKDIDRHQDISNFVRKLQYLSAVDLIFGPVINRLKVFIPTTEKKV